MNIAQTLTRFLDVDDRPSLYGFWHAELTPFINGDASFPNRRTEAIRLISVIMTAHGKNPLLQYVADLAKVEAAVKDLHPWRRDHVVHALLTFILGIYVNDKFMVPQYASGITPLQWKLTGLLHDVGYPLQIGKGIMAELPREINKIKRKLTISTPDLKVTTMVRGLEKLQNNRNGLSLIQIELDRCGLQISAQDKYHEMILGGDVCHGMISALTVLYVIDMLYQHYNPKRLQQQTMAEGVNWDETSFLTEVVPACAAIFIHNLPSSCFRSIKINPRRAPLAFLLKLCDTLQDWERPSGEDDKGLPRTAFDIAVQNNRLHFSAPDGKKAKLRADVTETLEAADIVIN